MIAGGRWWWLAFGGVTGVACTVFNGLPVDPPDGGVRLVDAGAPSALLPNLPDAVDVCAWVFACPNLAASIAASMAIPTSDYNFSLCLSWLNGPLDPERPGAALQSNMLGCIAPAASCDEAMQCLPVEKLSAGDPRCVADAGSCAFEGGAETAIDCVNLEAVTCTSARFEPGTECIATGGTAQCGLGLCSATSTPTCSEGVQIACDPATNVKSGLAVGTLGRDCSATPIACSKLGATSCAGTSVVVCDGQAETSYNCALGQSGATCVTEGNFAYCQYKNDCSPSGAGTTYCTGATLSACVGGAVQSFDCTTQGLHCVPASGNQTAHCG